MTDLDPSPLVAVLAQSLLLDETGKGAVIKELADDDDVKKVRLEEGALEPAITKCIEQLVTKLGPVPLGFELDKWGRVRPQSAEGGEEPQAADGGEEEQQRAAAQLEGVIVKCLPAAASKVLASPELPFEFVMLVGYLGHGAIDKTYRLYADPTLDDFTSLRKDDIVFRHRFHTENAPFDEVDVVWVKRIATVGRDRRQPRRAEVVARFLEGELMDAAEAGSALPTRIEGAASDEPFCVSFTCCKRTSVCRPRGR